MTGGWLSNNICRVWCYAMSPLIASLIRHDCQGTPRQKDINALTALVVTLSKLHRNLQCCHTHKMHALVLNVASTTINLQTVTTTTTTTMTPDRPRAQQPTGPTAGSVPMPHSNVYGGRPAHTWQHYRWQTTTTNDDRHQRPLLVWPVTP